MSTGVGLSEHLLAGMDQPQRMVQHSNHAYNASMHGSNSSFGGGNSLADASWDSPERIDRLQSLLSQRLGPEYVAQRPGPGGAGKLTYVEGWRLINIANEVFGFNGWSSQVISIQIDFCDQLDGNRFNVCASAIVRVTLRDGVFHEDVGTGSIDNARGKAAAFDKCKKEAVTDAMKRALRYFGNATGNCVYDKRYCAEVMKHKKEPEQVDASSFRRPPKGSGSANASGSNTSLPPPPQQQPARPANASVAMPKPPVASTSGQNLPAKSHAPTIQHQLRAPPPPQQQRPPPPPVLPQSVTHAVKKEPAPPQRDDSFSDFDDIDEDTLAAMLDTDTGPPILHEDSGFVSPSDTSTFDPTGHSTVIHLKPSPTAQFLPLPTSKPNSSSSSSSRSGPSNRNDPEAAAKRRAAIDEALHASDSAPAPAPAGENAARPRGASSPRTQALRLAAIEQAMGSEETRAPAPAHPQVRPHRPPPTALGGFQFPDGMNASTSQNQPAVKRTADGYHKVAGEMRQPFAPIQIDPSGAAKRARY